MVNLAHVKIWGEMVGYLFWREDNQTATFEYTPEFKKLRLDLSPIVMPLTSQRVYSFSNISRDTFLGLPGLFADSLPDAYGKALLDRWLASNGRNFANPVERLCYQGKRSMGALEFEPAHNDYLETSSNIEIDSLVATAREVLNQREAFSTNMSDTKETLINIIKVGTSAGGQRAKAIIA